MASTNDWRRAYAQQARIDLNAREALLGRPDIPACQQLHFLQMACEKTCKAYLCGRGADPASLQSSHAYIAATLPVIARQQFARQAGQRQQSRSWLIQHIRVLARQIELLAPAVDDAGRQPANCEYPWLDSAGVVRVPATHNFGINLQTSPGGRHLMKVLYDAVEDELRNNVTG